MQYLQKRFEKGKLWVEDYMASHHRCMALSLPEAHADLLQFQRSEQGGQGLLHCIQVKGL